MLDPTRYLEEPFGAQLVERDGVATLRLVGAFDQSARRQFEQRLDGRPGRRTRKLILDLSAVTFIDSAALALILELWSRSRRDGFGLEVRSPSGQVARVFKIVGLDHALPIAGEAAETASAAAPSSLPRKEHPAENPRQRRR